MEAKYSKTVAILPSQLDPYGKLSVPDTFNLFMDIATEAAGELGVGFEFLRKKGLFWITVKTKIQFLDRPGVLDVVRVDTWPERPGERRCNRHYELSRDGEVLIRAKTEWAIVSVLTKRPQAMAKVLPATTDYPDALACPEPFPMINEGFAEPPFAEHAVRATDIDMARHMNNVAYVRAIVDAFSVKEWKKLDVRQFDIIFRSSAHEGDVLKLYKRREGDALDICGKLPNGEISVLARLKLGN